MKAAAFIFLFSLPKEAVISIKNEKRKRNNEN